MLKHMTTEKDIVGPPQERMIFPVLDFDRLQVNVAVATLAKHSRDLLADNKILLDTKETAIGRAEAVKGARSKAVVENVFLREANPSQTQNALGQKNLPHAHISAVMKETLPPPIYGLKNRLT